jgi:CMP/dCMP kinase
MQVIAIDGPAASGKSSVARRVAKQLGWLYVNTGNMYRAATWAALDRGVDVHDNSALIKLAHELHLDFIVGEGMASMLTNGHALTDMQLNSEAVNGAVSIVAQVPEIRTRLVNAQRALTAHGSLVIEGRDIGSVVFPDTPHKFYIDANEEVRAARRSQQGLRDTVGQRDQMDRSRKTAPLIIPEGAEHIDSSEMSLEEVVQKVMTTLVAQGVEV